MTRENEKGERRISEIIKAEIKGRRLPMSNEDVH